MIIASIPSPDARGLAPRTPAGARLRAGHPARRRGRDLGGGAALGGSRGHAGHGRRHRRLGGAVRPGRRPARTTWSPTRSCTSRSGKNPWAAFYVWEGGLGVWGAIAVGCLGGYLALPAQGHLVPARSPTRWRPGSCSPQAIGRWGNYFNQELLRQAEHAAVGRRDRPGAPRDRDASIRDVPAHLPLRVDLGPRGRRAGDLGRAAVPARLRPGVRALRHGLHVGRVWIEYLRVDTANHLFGVRINVFTSVVLFLLALAFFVVSAQATPGRQAGRTPRAGPSGSRSTSRCPLTETGRGRRRAERSGPPQVDGPRRAGRGAIDDDDGATGAPSRGDRARARATPTGGWLRPAVFGAMDGLVSNFALIAGIVGGTHGDHSHEVILAGLAGLAAGAFSMAAGEYTSVASQAEYTQAEIEVERREIQLHPKAEQAELAQMYVDRGIDPELAEAIADAGPRGPGDRGGGARPRGVRRRPREPAEPAARGGIVVRVVRDRRRAAAAAVPARARARCCRRW